MQADVVPVIWTIAVKALVGLAIAGLGALFMYPFKKAKKEWASLKQSIADAQTELVQQRTNHLSHIEADGNKQVELLGKVVDTLEAIHLGQAEMSGYIKASLNK